MRQKKLLQGFLVWLFCLSLLTTGSSNLYAQKTEKLPDEQHEKLRIEAYNNRITTPASNSKAQVILEEHFNDGTFPPADWTLITNGAGWDQFNWGGGDRAAYHNDDYGNNDDWLISPAIEIPGGMPILSFWEEIGFASWMEFHGIFISESADMSDSVLIYQGDQNYDGWYYQQLSLNEFVGKTIYVGFNYKGFWASEWLVDDVVVKAIFDGGCSDLSYLGGFGNYMAQLGFKIGDEYFTSNADFRETTYIDVPYSTDVTALKLNYEASCGATVKVGSKVQASGVTANNFTNPVKYSVVNADGITRDYLIGVSKIDPIVDFSIADAIDAWLYNDTIYVTLPANENLTSQVVEFEMYDAAYTLKAGTTALVNGVTAIDVSGNVTLTATAGTFTKTYVLIVSQENPVNWFGFSGYKKGSDYITEDFPVYADIDIEAMTIDIAVPYGADETQLYVILNGESYISSFTYDGTVIYNGDLVDFSGDKDLVVALNAPAKAESLTYKVNVVQAPPSDANEILSVGLDNLADDIVWDTYGRKITAVVMFDSTENILPELTISNHATVDTVDAAFNLPADGDTTITYKVTAQSGAVATWLLTIMEEAPSKEAELLDFAFGGQLDGWFNEDEDTLLLNVAVADLDLSKVKVTDLEVSFGAVISPSAVSPTTTDFSSNMVKYTVTAQDTSVKVEYAAYIFKEETVAPTVSLTAATFRNYDQEVPVKVKDASLLLGGGNDGGVALFHNSLDVADLLANGGMEDAMEAGLAVAMGIPEGTTDSVFNVPTDNLVAGVYYAYAADYFGNISTASADSIVIVVDTAAVETLAEIKYPNVIYRYNGQAIVTYTQAPRHQKWMQDETMGMMVDDTSGHISDTVKIGDALTGIVGKLVDMDGALKFQPVPMTKDSVMIVSRGNTVTPMEISIDTLKTNVYRYQNMLVKLTNISFQDADASNYFTDSATYSILDYVTWNAAKFRTTFTDADYLGDTIPYGIYDIVGVKNVHNNGAGITARSWDDIMEVEGSEFVIDPEEWEISMIGIDDAMKTFYISNHGVESFTIETAFIEGDPEFSMNNIYNWTVGSYSNMYFNVYFTPQDFGNYSSMLTITLTNGDVYEVPLTASVQNIPVVNYPYATNFNTEDDIVGWVVDNNGPGAGFQWGEGLSETNSFYRVGYDNPIYSPVDDVMLISPPINMSSAVAPVIKWNNAMWNPGYAYTELYYSTDEKQTWHLISSIATNPGGVQIPLEYNISMVAGNSKVYFGFNLYEPDYGAGSPITWWDIDDFEVKESPTVPMFATSTDSIGMGVVDGTMTEELVISNGGASYFTLDSNALKAGSSAFALSNVPTAAVEVYEQEVSVDVTFDGSIGAQVDTILIYYTDVRNGNMVVAIPVTAFGVGCAAPIAAVEGDNEAPYAPSWFSFTPANNALITISSCGDVVDTDVKVFKGCDGKLVAANDDSGCPNYASEVVFPAEGGVTYMINWLPTWSADGFTFNLMVEDLPTGPTLLSVEATAINANEGQAALTFVDMIQLIPDTKGGNGNVYAESAIEKPKGISKMEYVESVSLNSAKTFVPDGDDEGEPNGNRIDAKVLTVGTADAPAKITGKYGVTGDYDWFAVLQSEVGFYFDITLEVEAGTCDLFLVYWNATEESWYGFQADPATADAPTSFSFTQLDRGTDSLFIWVRRAGSMAAVAEPGYGYNLKVWSSAPPTFSIYRDNQKIAGPESMAFTYLDQGIKLDQQYCYAITQEKYDGSESALSNSICVTAKAGPGDICTKAMPVEPGLNESPKSPYWFTYTPAESKMVTISSNIEENGDPGEDWNDTWLFIYANCDDETPLYENDDVQNGVIRTSYLEFPVVGGETYLINWRRWAAEGEVNAYDSEPFYFTIEEADMLAGDIVETAIPVELPLVDMAGTTAGFNHDYDATACDYIFMEGSDMVYKFSVSYGGTITGGISGNYVGMHVISGTPGNDECVAFAGGATGGTFADAVINPGEYYIVVSTKLPYDEEDFVMNLAYTPAAKQTVTFNVDMNTQITLGNFDPAADSVDIVGTFTYWEHTTNLADDDGDGVYTLALPTEFNVGEVLKYKYRINADWEKAEFSSDIYGNRVYTVAFENNVTNDLYNDLATPMFDVTFRVVMSRQKELGMFDPTSNEVSLTANVDDIPALTDADGTLIYETTVSVEYGDVITYNFNIDGTAEEVDVRTTEAITENTVITVWYNNDDKVNVDGNLANSVSVYPNPASTAFTVDFGIIGTENTVVQLVDVSGQVIKSIDMNNRAIVNIDATKYAKGVYYLKITDGDHVGVQKVVIQ